MARIVLPPAVMRVLPSLASAQVSLVKDTSPVAIISMPELFYVSLKRRAESYRILEVLTAVTVIYWLLGYPRQTRRLDSSTLEGCGMTTSDPILPARDVRNSYGKLVALDGVSVSVGAARWSV